MPRSSRIALLPVLFLALSSAVLAADPIRDLQTQAIVAKKSPVGHWGADPENYTEWGTHTNRLIPVYTFGTRNAPPGARLADYTGKNSPYRSEDALRRIYGRVPPASVAPEAESLDQTNVYDIQKAAFDSGKKRHIFLVVFDGMDWQTTRAAAIAASGAVTYSDGRGSGLHMLDYTANGTTEYGWMVTSPHNEGTKVDVDMQTVLNPGGTLFGGYDIASGGPTPWQPGSDIRYLIAKGAVKHAYTDSSCSASSMTAGIKSYNGAVNVDFEGTPVTTIAHRVQEAGWSVGAVSSVPIGHATPAAAYAHNVDRDDYQDLTRDLLGQPSISHPEKPLPGLDVLIGGGHGLKQTEPKGQGTNFVPGLAYMTPDVLRQADVETGGKYVVAQRSPGKNGVDVLQSAARQAAQSQHRLFGFFGVGKYGGHLPFATADGDFQPAPGKTGKVEAYAPEDLSENPTLADMTAAALAVLSTNPKGFWLMVEPGDVDWANHDNNLDNSIGAVRSGDLAVKTITDWVETHSNWDESLLIVTADHGHYLFLDRPELLAAPSK